jgi:hypothetical protein
LNATSQKLANSNIFALFQLRKCQSSLLGFSLKHDKAHPQHNIEIAKIATLKCFSTLANFLATSDEWCDILTQIKFVYLCQRGNNVVCRLQASLDALAG